MTALRTPDENFADLPGYDFAPHYVDDLAGSEGLRLHYLDEGPADGKVALCLHGQPTWSFLYRKMIPAFTAAGMRVLAPDFFGFGRSDKPVDEAVYSFDFHRAVLLAFAERHRLRDATLVCQDWGGLLGLTLPMDLPGAFDRLIVMNTTLATGDTPLSDGFLAWRAFNNSHPDMDIAGLMKRAVPGLTDAEAAAYAAPFPDASYKEGVRRFPNLVPDGPDAPGAAISRRARDWWSKSWSGRSFMAIGMQDPVLGAAMRVLHGQIRNCPPPLELADAGHFTQEAGRVIVTTALASFDGANA
jgi:haloalkane dehalogenase/tRNA(adenine34) deaminase